MRHLLKKQYNTEIEVNTHQYIYTIPHMNTHKHSSTSNAQLQQKLPHRKEKRKNLASFVRVVNLCTDAFVFLLYV